MATEPEPPSLSRPKSRHRARNVVIVVIVLIFLVFVVLFAIPFSMPFSFSSSTYYERAFIVPAGSQVSGTFNTNNTDKVGFSILGAGMNPTYQADSSNGSFSFTSQSPGFTFQIFLFGQDCTVEVSGHYTAPIIWSPSVPIP